MVGSYQSVIVISLKKLLVSGSKTKNTSKMGIIEWLDDITFYQVISVALQATAVGFGIRTFDRANEIREETLDWNKKIATEKELSNKPSSKVSHKLNEKLNLRDVDGIIKLSVIEKAIEDDSTLDGNINHLLNRYDRLARGIVLGIYDDEMAKTALKTIFIKNYVNFSEYIESKQNPKDGSKGHPNAFRDFKAVANRWNGEID